MALCSVTELRACYSPKTLSNDDLEGIINQKSVEIARRARGSPNSTNSDLNQACINASAAQAMRKARANGELAGRVKIGNDELQNTNIEADIQAYEEKAEWFIQMYLYSGGITLPYGRVGYDTVDSTDR